MRRLIIVGMGLLSRGMSELIASLQAVPVITVDDLAPDRDCFADNELNCILALPEPCALLAQPRPYIHRLKGPVRTS